MKIAITIALAALLCACASPVKWRNPLKNQQEFHRDNAECLAMSGSGQPAPAVPGGNAVMDGYNQGAALGAAAGKRDIYRQCMLGKGYSEAG